jgi:hypothetical protein
MVAKSKLKTKVRRKKTAVRRKSSTKINSSTISLFVGSIILLMVMLALGFYLVINTYQFFAANFADDILRPAFGSQTTVSIEAVFFKIEDRVNKVKYFFVKPNPSKLALGPVGINNKTTNDDGKFVLSKITPFSVFSPLKGEGEWKLINTASPSAVMAETFFRPDPQRDFAMAYLVKMNMNLLVLSEVAGTVEPGGYANPGPGKILIGNSKSLIAAFNGGFQRKDGQYGMIVGNKTYLPLQKNLATLVIYKNAKPKIVNYSGQNLGTDVAAVRQNGPMLLQNSKDVSSSNAWNMQSWGLTTTNSMYTWRSGLGVTKDGDLIYAAGSSLVPETLAAALKAAGAVNAMQLDINPVWVRFVIFNSLSNGRYKYYSLTKDMVNGGAEYLSGYQKDFFYLMEK